MKKLLFSIAFLCAMFSNAQTIKTTSSCDSNNDGQVDITDVTATVNKVLGKTTATSAAADKQMVTADDLNDLLKGINYKLNKIEETRQQVEVLKRSISAIAEKLNATTPEMIESTTNGHDYVDLGLSVKWATMNVGATEIAGSKINPTTGLLDCYGNYYAWAETTPKDKYTYSNLKYHSGDYENGTYSKYVVDATDGSTVDNKTTLDFSDDAARVNWGGQWRMPTYEEVMELQNNCYWEWTSNYNNTNVGGYIVYQVKSDGDKGKVATISTLKPALRGTYALSDTHIFLPQTSPLPNRSEGEANTGGCYWSSSLRDTTETNEASVDNNSAISVLTNPYVVTQAYTGRAFAFPVRAVYP